MNGLLPMLTALIYPWNRKMGKEEIIVRTLIHYILINVIARKRRRSAARRGEPRLAFYYFSRFLPMIMLY